MNKVCIIIENPGNTARNLGKRNKNDFVVTLFQPFVFFFIYVIQPVYVITCTGELTL